MPAASARGQALEDLDEAALAVGAARDRKREWERPLMGSDGVESLLWMQYDNAERANLRLLDEAWTASRQEPRA